jgi:Uma2 family endonuclease
MRLAMVPESLLEERRRLGHDRRDEVWDGVLHMVPSPSAPHQRLLRDLLFVLHGVAQRRGLVVLSEFDLHDPATQGYEDYREPDVVIVDRKSVTKRGVEGCAELAVEILSPNDESRDKLPFYARVGVREVWLIDPRKCTLEIFVSLESVHVSRLGLELDVDGAILTIRDGDDVRTVDISDTF